MDDTQNIVAVGYGINYYAKSAQVKNAVYVQLLGVHFAIDTVNMLYSAENRNMQFLLETLFHFALNIGHKRFESRHTLLKSLHYLVVARWVEVHQRQVLELPFCFLHTEAVGNGGVDLHRFKRFDALLFLGLICHSAHIVQPVGNLNQDNADILRHCHEHLAQIFHLLVFLAGVLHSGQLRNSLDDIRDRLAELPCNIVMSKLSVLNYIVQQGCNDRVLVKPHVNGDIRRCYAVGDIGGTVLAELTGVGKARHVVGRTYPADVHIHAGAFDFLHQCFKHSIRVKRLSVKFFGALICIHYLISLSSF